MGIELLSALNHHQLKHSRMERQPGGKTGDVFPYFYTYITESIMGKRSVLRNLSGRGKTSRNIRVSSHQVKQYLADKYELSSEADIVEFAVSEENGDFERGVYKIRAFGKGEVVAKVIHKQEKPANEYFNEIQNTHLAWQNDSSLGPYILKVKIRSRKPDFQCSSELLYLEFEVASETLTQRLKKRNRYRESERHENLTTLLKALTHLHQRGDEVGRNFHGDIKPDNLFIVQHRNADGNYVDSLKIGDIEENLGTLPYRDFTTTSCRGWENGDLPPTEKKDDLMAVKMILLEMAYDFNLFEFCSHLMKKGKNHLQDFLESDAQQRKNIIEKNIGNQKYLKSLPIENALNGETMATLLQLLKELPEKVEKVQHGLEKLIKRTESGYWKNPLIWLVGGLAIIAGIVVMVNEWGKYLYINSPTMHYLTHLVGGGIIFSVSFTLLVIVLGIPKDKPNRIDGKIKYGNILCDVGVAFLVALIVLILFFFVGDLGSYRGNSYFKNYRTYVEKNNVPDQEIPGVKLDFDTECVNGGEGCFFSGKYQNDRYILTLTLNNETIPADRLSLDFIKANRQLLEKLLGLKLIKILNSYGVESMKRFKQIFHEYKALGQDGDEVSDEQFNSFLRTADPDTDILDTLVLLHYLETYWGKPGIRLKDSFVDVIESKFKTEFSRE
jgi:hypothetical protein